MYCLLFITELTYTDNYMILIIIYHSNHTIYRCPLKAYLKYEANV